MINTDWLNETIEYIPGHNFIYRVVCFAFRRKLTYQEMYAMLWEINKKPFGDEAKDMAAKQIVRIYKKLHNNELPKDFEKLL